MFTFNEFFAGGGFVRLGLRDAWSCLYANDIDASKGQTYRANFGGEELTTKDIRTVRPSELRKTLLTTASFPCQDHTSASIQLGFADGVRGSLVFNFLNLMRECELLGTAPAVIVLENVSGLIGAARGKDLEAVLTGLASLGYKFGGLTVDARLFVPQSRPRLFIIAVKATVAIPKGLVSRSAQAHWHTRPLQDAIAVMAPTVRRNWLWWNPPRPPTQTKTLANIVEPYKSENEKWREGSNVKALLKTCTPADRARLKAARKSGEVIYGVVTYKPGNRASGGNRSLVFRLDGLSGCLMKKVDLRYQQLCRIQGNKIEIRPMTRLELARLMGLPSTYRLPASVSKTAQLTGDGVVVPVIRWLAQHLLEPLAQAAGARAKPATGVVMRAPPQRARKELPPITGNEGGPIKETTFGNTVYLLPEEHIRLFNLAAEHGVAMQEMYLRGLDALYMQRGEPPVRRPLPRRRGRGVVAVGEGDISLLISLSRRAGLDRVTSRQSRGNHKRLPAFEECGGSTLPSPLLAEVDIHTTNQLPWCEHPVINICAHGPTAHQ